MEHWAAQHTVGLQPDTLIPGPHLSQSVRPRIQVKLYTCLLWSSHQHSYERDLIDIYNQACTVISNSDHSILRSKFLPQPQLPNSYGAWGTVLFCFWVSTLFILGLNPGCRVDTQLHPGWALDSPNYLISPLPLQPCRFLWSCQPLSLRV